MLEFGKEENVLHYYKLLFKREDKVFEGTLCLANPSFDYLLNKMEFFLSEEELFLVKKIPTI